MMSNTAKKRYSANCYKVSYNVHALCKDGLWLKAHVKLEFLEKFNLISFFMKLMEHSFRKGRGEVENVCGMD
jgi:hypothetical protein